MAYPQDKGQTDKVLNTGRIAYGGDGTNFYPLKVDSSGNLQIELLAGTASIGTIGAGTARIGTVSGVLKVVSVTKALEATGSAYSANDVLCETDTNTFGTAWTFSAIARENGAYGAIVTAMVISESEIVAPRLTLFLFNATPTGCELDDNAFNTAPDATDLAKYVGRIDFPAMDSVGTTDSNAVATPSTVGNLPLFFKCASDADDLIGVLVTRDAFNQTATDDMTVVLVCEQY